MGFKFQKRIKLLPGVTLNLSRKGVSTSVGTTGARVTVGHGQQRVTTGLPGTGISHTKVTSTTKTTPQPAAEPIAHTDTFTYRLGALIRRFFQ